MSILSKLFATKLEEEAITIKDVEDLIGREIDNVESLYNEVYTDEYRLYSGDLPASATTTFLGRCEYCGNDSGKSDGRSGCVSCGAPLPKITKQTELSYYYTT